jgi:hypothetical protein
MQQMQQLEDQFNQDFGRTVDSTLTDRQLRARYDQLNTQFQGFNAFNNPQLARQLQLTGAQRNQLRRLASEWRRGMMDWRRDLGDDVNAADAQQQWAQFRSQYMDQLNAILTPQQQQMWGQVVGQQYDFPYNMHFPSTGRGTAAGGALGRDPSTGAVVTPDPGVRGIEPDATSEVQTGTAGRQGTGNTGVRGIEPDATSEVQTGTAGSQGTGNTGVRGIEPDANSSSGSGTSSAGTGGTSGTSGGTASGGTSGGTSTR